MIPSFYHFRRLNPVFLRDSTHGMVPRPRHGKPMTASMAEGGNGNSVSAG